MKQHRLVVVVALFALIVAAGCAPGGPAGASPAASAAPGAGTAAAATSHVLPQGATGTVDPGAWALADRLLAPAYTTDTTAALVDGLAAAGIGTYADPTSALPERPVAQPASPFRLLDFQVHELAVGVWAGASFRGDELDGAIPIPSTISGFPATSALLAGYVATADTAGGSLARALMAGEDLLVPAQAEFPGVVLVLFASDLADHANTSPGAPSGGPEVSPAAIRASLPMARLAIPVGAGRAHGIEANDGGICSETANWVRGAIAGLFAALKVADVGSPAVRIVKGIWNWLVDKAQAAVQGLLDAVDTAVLGTIRSVADSISAAAMQIASLMPQSIRIQAAGAGGGATFKLGADPLPGTYTATVTSGDLPDWPAVLKDCTETANISLPDFHSKGTDLVWGPLEAPANPLLSSTEGNKMADVTDASGRASWAFLTSVDPGGDPPGEQRNQFDEMPVTVHRPEVQQARDKLSSALLGSIPGLLRPYVGALFAPYLDGLQSRINTLLDAHGRGVAIIVFHDQGSPRPTPSAPPSPAPSGACSPNPLAGTYAGTATSTSRETIDIGNANLVGNVLATSTGSGPATIVIAPDGSVSGSWSIRTHLLYHEVVMSYGAGIDDLRDEVYDSVGTSVAGPACDLSVGFGGISIVTCTDSLKGDCSNEAQPPRGTQQIEVGAPTSVAPTSVTWTWTYTETGGQPSITATFTLAVSRQ